MNFVTSNRAALCSAKLRNLYGVHDRFFPPVSEFESTVSAILRFPNPDGLSHSGRQAYWNDAIFGHNLIELHPW